MREGGLDGGLTADILFLFIIKVYSMVRGRVKVSVRVRGWRLMGRVYGWAKAKVRVRLT